MTPAAMQELAVLLRAGKATVDERQLLQDAIQDDNVETLADLDGAAASAYATLLERAAGPTPASAAPALALHAFELYGLGRPPALFLGAYGLDPHHACDLLTFCRNPLHPGPCKGWKDRLKVVAPGVHKMIEDERKAKVAKRRAERTGQGKGRDGDGDGKKGEDDSKKPPKKPRATAKDKPEKDVPYAEPGHDVKLRKETRALVAAAVKSLPKDDAGWHAVVQGEEETFRPVDEMVTNALTRYAQAVVKRNTARDNYAKALSYDSWEDLSAKNQGLADTLTNGPTGKDLEREIKAAGEAHDQIKTYRDALDAKILAAGGDPKAGIFPAQFAHLARSYGYVTRRKRLEYPQDANGANMVPPELAKHAESVLKAGAAIRQDLDEAFRSDPQMKEINGRADKLSKQVMSGEYYAQRDARKALAEVQLERRRRERELVVDALDQFRPMGGSKIDNVKPITQRSDLDFLGRQNEKVARRDWRTQLETAGRYLPNDWVDRSNKTPMNVISSDRAFHSAPDDWRSLLDDPDRKGLRESTLAMTSQKGESGVLYNGAFGSYSEEVTLHEYGHRMESQIPGIKALEFAYVRKKATLPNGNLEPLVNLKARYGGGYKDGEVSYEDKFPDLYTGKTYEARNGDPANESWEAFQVGLQDTFGRGTRKFGEPDLQDLVLGAMATLGRG